MKSFLLDSSALIALVISDHEHHQRVSEWFQNTQSRFALCPITEGALGRYLLRTGESAAGVAHLLTLLHDHPRIEFWPDSISYLDVPLMGLRGHRQLTDAYLVALAASRKARLATLDIPLAATWPKQALLIPDSSTAQ
ncbi:MAG: PIN domain-containing protein [Propionibacteriaceae bacterium]|nr:PIN domain-containing protein [Propionibacteriaceae bacterium]